MHAIRPVALVLGILLTSLGAVMLVPALYDLAMGSRNWEGFAISAGATLFIGIGMTIATWGPSTTFSVQQAFIMTSGAWVVLALFAALPLPFDIAGIWAGTIRYPPHRFIIYVAAGKVVKITSFAFAAYYGVGWLLD